MPHFVKIDNSDDFQWLKTFINNWHVRCEDNVSAYVEHREKFQRLHEAFENAKLAEAVKVINETQPVEEVKPKRTRKPEAQRVMETPNYCKDHPKYGAKRPPRTDCQGCWGAYEKYSGKYAAKQARLKFDRRTA